jgi:hypothetical protein
MENKHYKITIDFANQPVGLKVLMALARVAMACVRKDTGFSISKMFEWHMSSEMYAALDLYFASRQTAHGTISPTDMTPYGVEIIISKDDGDNEIELRSICTFLPEVLMGLEEPGKISVVGKDIALPW